MNDIQKLELAMDLLERIACSDVNPPDPFWFRDYFLLTGDHMILTDEGWQPGECKQSLMEEYLLEGDSEDSVILEEVNKPSVS